MTRFPPNSTRLMGYHLRQYKTAEGDETEMFSARIYFNDIEIGRASNGGNGGPDRIDIFRDHKAWDLLVTYMREHPVVITADGMADTSFSAEDAALTVLRDLHQAEKKLARSRTYRSGVLGYGWEQPFDDGESWATASIMLSTGPTIPIESVDSTLFRILVLGVDNPGFARPFTLAEQRSIGPDDEQRSEGPPTAT